MIESSELSKLLGRRLKTIRKEMKLKQSQFARMVGLSEDAIGLIERGKILPRLESLCKIADNLNISLLKLLDFEESIAPKSTKKKVKSIPPPLSSLNLYLKTKSHEQVQMIHDIALNIFDKKPSYSKKSSPKHFIIRDK